jgi:hypothetical protein
MKRRELLKSLAVASAVSAVAPRVWAEEHTEADKEVEYLFVQNAREVSLQEGVLTLKGISPETLYFSDRPDRIVGRVTTQEFVDSWAKGDDSFKADPPNAVLSILHGSETKDIVVVLKEPRLEGSLLAYDVEVLDGYKVVHGGNCALFIDVIGRPLTPLSFAGVARRTSRRTARRVVRRN